MAQQVRTTPALMKAFMRSEAGQPLRRRLAFGEALEVIDPRSRQDRLLLLIGLRGSGKTTLMAQLHQELLNIGVDESRMAYVQLDESKAVIGAGVLEIAESFSRSIMDDLILPTQPAVLFLDEVHYDSDWSVGLKVIYDKMPGLAVIASGSSALQMTSAGDLSRRGRQLLIGPLGLREYTAFSGGGEPSASILDKTMLFGQSDAASAYRLLQSARSTYKRISRSMISNYLVRGSLPIGLRGIPLKEVMAAHRRIMEKVVFRDLPAIYGFDNDTCIRLSQMLYLLAGSDRISYEKIGRTVGLSKRSVNLGIVGLVAAGILLAVPVSENAYASRRATPRYKFAAPALRAACLDVMGELVSSSNVLGQLLEDAVAEHLHRSVLAGSISGFTSNPDPGSPDFQVRCLDGTRVDIEVGWGWKDQKQVVGHRQDKVKFSLVTSDRGPELAGTTLFVPIEAFLSFGD
jgi:predicted AAA+ superfamily ATPase